MQKQKSENTHQMVFVLEKLSLLDVGRSLEPEDEKWRFNLNGLITPRGYLSYFGILAERGKLLSLEVEASGYLNFEDLLDKEQFEDEYEDWEEYGDDYDNAYQNYISRDIAKLSIAASKGGPRLIIIFFDFKLEPFAMASGHIDNNSSDMGTLNEYAECLRDMSWLTRVLYVEQ